MWIPQEYNRGTDLINYGTLFIARRASSMAHYGGEWSSYDSGVRVKQSQFVHNFASLVCTKINGFIYVSR